MGNNGSNQEKEPPIKMIKRLAVNFGLLVLFCIVLMVGMKSLSGKRQAELKQLQELCDAQKTEIVELDKQVKELNDIIENINKTLPQDVKDKYFPKKKN